jgi:hypothetical protein
MEPVDLQDDLRAEVALILCEHSDEKILSIHNSHPHGLRFYTVRIILNLIQSKTSPFFRKYRQPICEYSDSFERIDTSEDFDTRLKNELKEQRVISIIENMYWYDREILKLYMEKGDYRAVAKEVNIPWGSIYDTVQMAMNKIKFELRTGVSWEVASKIKRS